MSSSGRSRTLDPPAATSPRLHWYREVLIVVAFYGVYSLVRNQFGSASVRPAEALGNALTVIRIERALDLFIEQSVQELFLGWELFVRLWNIFYGTLHFIVTGTVMVLLYRRAPQRYRRWRTTLGFTTGLALVGFSLFPLMPPRLLGDFGPFGGRHHGFDFVDTLATIGGLWSFNSESMKSISNQYAAMPSLHVAWAVWSALAILPLVRRSWARALWIAYPFVTLFAVVVTANHYLLDGVGGVAVLAIGWRLSAPFERFVDGRVRPLLVAVVPRWGRSVAA